MRGWGGRKKKVPTLEEAQHARLMYFQVMHMLGQAFDLALELVEALVHAVKPLLEIALPLFHNFDSLLKTSDTIVHLVKMVSYINETKQNQDEQPKEN